MKKITLIALLAFSGAAFAQTNQGVADVNAEIVSPIAINDGSAMNFGTIKGTATGGDVTIATDGSRTFTNTDMDITSTNVSAATFEITAGNGVNYDISIPNTVLTGAGDDMTLSFAHDRNDAGDRIGDGSAQTLNVGGTLQVNNSQAAGSYTGEVNVTVNYN